MAIRLTQSDTFDGIDIEISRGSGVLLNALVTSAVARIKKADGTVQERELTIGPEEGRYRYRMVAGDYTHFPGPGNYRYQVALTMSDGTKKAAPSVGTLSLKVAEKF